jgi:hypothetical protein
MTDAERDLIDATLAAIPGLDNPKLEAAKALVWMERIPIDTIDHWRALVDRALSSKKELLELTLKSDVAGIVVNALIQAWEEAHRSS